MHTLRCGLIIQVHNQKVQFAPIGLIDMYNSGGAIQAVDISSKSSASGIHIKGRGPGTFGAYSSTRPRSCAVNSEEREFEFREDKLLKIRIPARSSSWDIVISY